MTRYPATTTIRIKMAELPMGKGVSAGKIASNVQKKITRAQEKVRHFNSHIYNQIHHMIPVVSTLQHIKTLKANASSSSELYKTCNVSERLIHSLTRKYYSKCICLLYICGCFITFMHITILKAQALFISLL